MQMRLSINQPKQVQATKAYGLSAHLTKSLSRGMHCLSVLWQSSSSFQVGFDLNCVLPKGALNLLVEVSVPVIDEVHIFVCMILTPPAVCVALVLPAAIICKAWHLHMSLLLQQACCGVPQKRQC